MPDVNHDVPIDAPRERVFECVSTAEGFAKWWSKGGTGEPGVGNEFVFDFGPEYHWKAIVEEFEPNETFVINMTDSDADWNGTRVKFLLSENGSGTMLRFQHLGWPEDNAHYRSSSYCWAMYLRCLKMFAEDGIVLDYDRRFKGFRS